MTLYVPGCRVVGLDIGSRCIKAVQLTTGLSDFKLTGFLVKERTGLSREELAADLRSMGEDRMMEADILVVSFPSPYVLFRNTELPFSQVGRIQSTIRYEAENLMVVPLDEMVIDFMLLDATAAGSSVMVVAVRRNLVDEYVDALQQGGIAPDIIDIDSLALASIMEYSGDSNPVAVLDIGAQKISLSIYEEGKLRLTRSVPLGARKGGIAEWITPALQEVAFSIRAHLDSSGTIVEEVLLTGGGSREGTIESHVEKVLGVKSGPLDIIDGIPCTVPVDEELRSLGGVALGLALRGLTRDAGRVDLKAGLKPEARLIPPWLRTKLVRVGGAVALLLVLVVAHFFVGVAVKEKRYSMIKDEMRRVFSESFPGVKGVANEVQQATEMIRAMRERGVNIRGEGRASYLEVFRDIAERLPKDTKLILLEMDDTRINLRGVATSFSAVDEVETALKGSSYVQDVKVGNVELARRGGQGVMFKITLGRRER